MGILTRPLRRLFYYFEALMNEIFTADWNPLYQLGALGFFYYWIVAVSGIYLYIFFDVGADQAYASVEYLTHEQWYLGGVMRSLHRYASDGMVLMMFVHVVREFALGNFRGPKWFTWITGIPVFWLSLACGISGYWLVWDKLAQYVAVATTEWFDALQIFGEPIARVFMSPIHMDDRIFTLLTFIHIAVPLILLFILWIHLLRINNPKVNPNRGLAVGTFLMLLVLSFIEPALSQGPADLTQVTNEVGLDWFYLFAYPLMDSWGDLPTWAFAIAVSLILFILPWMPPRIKKGVATVNLDNCNGCRRCFNDCPFAAIDMMPRTDGLAYDLEAVVTADKCMSCGLCAGSCPTANPFRRDDELVPGIQLADKTVPWLREQVDTYCAALEGPGRVIIFGCENGRALASLKDQNTAVVIMPCLGAFPPSFIDYVISKRLADGVFLSGCGTSNCHNRLGFNWTGQRIAHERDPYLSHRVPRERVCLFEGTPIDTKAFGAALSNFRKTLSDMPSYQPPKRGQSEFTAVRETTEVAAQ
jgi:quinol-cytochrome oxidoreductase complex cytochrome b subunit/coenzyme F420-reducing hydrogenase delta subunit